MKVWITKYALTNGIIEAEATIDGTIAIIKSESSAFKSYYHTPDWYLTKEEAFSRAETMRVKQIKSLQNKVKKLNELKFE